MLMLTIVCVCLAWLPVAVLLINRRYYQPLPVAQASAVPCAVLIPARNEAHTLPACLEALLADPNPALRVWVLDDHSTDGTAAVVHMLAARDARVQLLHGAPLPPGWGGKMFACHQLATAALQANPTPQVLLFVDADVQVRAGTAGRVANLLHQQPELGLLSGVPKQLAGSAGERWLVQNIMLILIGFLPMWMLRGPRTSVAAGCGQFMAFTAAAYSAIGGHAAYRASVHDGVHLARAARAAGFRTHLANLTDAATCRMYPDAKAAWRGFRKNAHAGMATPTALPVWSVLLLGGHVLPWLLVMVGTLSGAWAMAGIAMLGVLANVALRAWLVHRCAQPVRLLWEHPVSVAYTIALQTNALWRHMRKQPEAWKGRVLAH
jgi:hypothetical protein